MTNDVLIALKQIQGSRNATILNVLATDSSSFRLAEARIRKILMTSPKADFVIVIAEKWRAS